MTSTELPPENQTDLPDDGPSQSGSSETTASAPDLTCPYCGREGRTERGLNVHVARAHPGQPLVDFSTVQERTAPPRPAALKGEVLEKPTVDLGELEARTAHNIRSLGELLHGALHMAKFAKVMNPQARIPPLDTHLAIALQLRAEATAHLLIGYAARNDTVMRALVAFNRLFEGSNDAEVVASLGLAALATIGAPAPGFLQGMVNADVMEHVAKENNELAQQVSRIRAAQTAAEAQKQGSAA